MNFSQFITEALKTPSPLNRQRLNEGIFDEVPGGDPAPNCYVAIAADSEKEARDLIQPNFIGDEPLVYVNKHGGRGPYGGKITFIFAGIDEVADDNLEKDGFLHDHFDLPNLPNLPIEFFD